MKIDELEDPFERVARRETAIRRALGGVEAERGRRGVASVLLWLTAGMALAWGALVLAHRALLPEPTWLLLLHVTVFGAAVVCGLATTVIVGLASSDRDSAPAWVAATTALWVHGLWGLLLAAHWVLLPEPTWLAVIHTCAFVVSAGVAAAVSGVLWSVARD